uniref:NADH dehydrogenase subunit 6 n=2 Tax=Sinohyriopsis TaxID=2706149 RepID=A0A455R3J2_SINSH|nr:NADH dehydrogenase subunit 6 [Sinohyriopsis cumingii]BBD51525.1 NADH dehydrogenase subunit 6 [Sinohyriopsis schlegelii]ACK57374.1 NADH dehydrogenase subunit 6 [Sinohyriopsis cumingii]ADI75211.1 NADH dehydrogenase subunit 6 [Sinohyriopsis cumingii]AIT70423.1 NADH dehydrogenase subunit 6 [Sinohyriopsis cumingii]BBD51538.1 NADH dehydrogenase subunit 6 [Sinohyriopsis schlegelii]
MTLLVLSTLWLYSVLTMTLPMHPLSLGMMVLLLAFISCTLISMSSPWYAYMLFFIFIGGMLVMFAYIASLSPNTTFSLNNQLMPIILTGLTLVFSKELSFIPNYQTNSDLELSINNLTQTLSSLYTQNGTACVILLACTLLFTMVASVKLCKPKSGALRPYL